MVTEKVKLSIELLKLRNDFNKESAQYQLLNNAAYEMNAADSEIERLSKIIEKLTKKETLADFTIKRIVSGLEKANYR